MMHPQPIVLTREEHIAQITSYWRQKDIDRLREEVLYDDVLRGVQLAMLEPQPRPIDWTIARDLGGALLLNFAAVFLGGYMLWQMIR